MAFTSPFDLISWSLEEERFLRLPLRNPNFATMSRKQSKEHVHRLLLITTHFRKFDDFLKLKYKKVFIYVRWSLSSAWWWPCWASALRCSSSPWSASTPCSIQPPSSSQTHTVTGVAIVKFLLQRSYFFLPLSFFRIQIEPFVANPGF